MQLCIIFITKKKIVLLTKLIYYDAIDPGWETGANTISIGKNNNKNKVYWEN